MISTVNPLIPTRPPRPPKITSTSWIIARNDIRTAAIFATSGIASLAPFNAASIIPRGEKCGKISGKHLVQILFLFLTRYRFDFFILTKFHFTKIFEF